MLSRSRCSTRSAIAVTWIESTNTGKWRPCCSHEPSGMTTGRSFAADSTVGQESSCQSIVESSFQAEQLQAVAVNHRFDLLLVQSREPGPVEHAVQTPQARDRGVHRRERI